MLRSICGALAIVATPAAAQTIGHSFDTTGNGSSQMSLNRTAIGETGPAALQMKVTGWQADQASNAVNGAFLAAYDGGIGVIGNGDLGGLFGYHQIDNAGGYTDFILLQFSREVTLSSIVLNSYTLGGDRTPDNDVAFRNVGALAPAVWDGSVNLSGVASQPNAWTAANSTTVCYVNCSRTLPGTGASRAWLVSSAFLPANTSARDDGFKISRINVTEAIPAVPEPATWAMMIIGFGATGFAVRRKTRITAAYAV